MVSRKAFQFFSEHAGGIVGERAQGVIALARAESLLERAVELEVASCEWVDDCEPYDPGDATSPAEAARLFESNAWTGPFGCIVKVGDEGHASLWGIVVGPRGTDDPYCRVVAAELAWEVADDLGQAIGDALDREALEAARGVIPPSMRAMVSA